MLMHFFLVDLVDLRTPVNFATKNIIIIITVWSSSTGARHRPARSEVEDKLLCTLHGRTMVQLPSHVALHTHNGRGTRAYYRLNYFNYEINYPDVFSLRRWAPSRSKVSPRPATDCHRNVRTSHSCTQNIFLLLPEHDAIAASATFAPFALEPGNQHAVQDIRCGLPRAPLRSKHNV